MSQDEVGQMIRAALSVATGRKDIEVTDSTHLVRDNILDSLDASVYLLELERASGKKITDKDVEDFNLFQISNMVDWLCK